MLRSYFLLTVTYVLFAPAVCPGVRESSQQVSQVRDSYSWVLSIPSKNLRMNFQEVDYYLFKLREVKRKGFDS